jgi:carbon dioxide concentrating mechanism protein CcmO
MLKSADVTLSAYEKTGAGLCTAIIRGSVSNVAVALESGMAEAERVGELHAVMLVPRPLDDLERSLPLAECWMEESLRPLRVPITVAEKQTDRPPLQPLELPVAVEVEPFVVEAPQQTFVSEPLPIEILETEAPPSAKELPIDPPEP